VSQFSIQNYQSTWLPGSMEAEIVFSQKETSVRRRWPPGGLHGGEAWSPRICCQARLRPVALVETVETGMMTVDVATVGMVAFTIWILSMRYGGSAVEGVVWGVRKGPQPTSTAHSIAYIRFREISERELGTWR